jgi:hypothetical protein
MDTVVQLAPDALVEGRPFAAPENTVQDLAVMRDMLERMRAVARGWLESPPEGPGALVRETDAAGLRTWIRAPDRGALLAAAELATVGFFGQARHDVDHAPIHELEERIVDSLDDVPFVLSYFNLELPDERYGNLVLCAAPDVPVSWRTHELHSRAVGLAPRHYYSARLHRGNIGSPLLGAGGLVLAGTRYFDFDSEPPWVAVRPA